MTEMTSYQFNHPKNYIGYVLALKFGGSRETADKLTEKYVVGGADMARRGAENMGLVEDDKLTKRGSWFVHRAPMWFECDDVYETLQMFDGLRGARSRFVDEFPRFADQAPDVILGDPAVEQLVDYLEEYHVEQKLTLSTYSISTCELFCELWNRDPTFAGELLIRDNEEIRAQVLTEDFRDLGPDHETPIHGVVNFGALEDGHIGETAIYRSPTTYQLKNLLWHMGVLKNKGVQAGDLDPRELEWTLEDRMIEREPAFTPTGLIING